MKVTDFKIMARIFRNAQDLSKSELNFVIERLVEFSEERDNVRVVGGKPAVAMALPFDADDEEDEALTGTR